MFLEQCNTCGIEVTAVHVPRPDTVHAGGELRCPVCQRHLRWVKSAKNEGRRTRTSRFTPDKLGIDHCQMCRRPRGRLAFRETLEIHHLDWNHENDTRENVMVLCTACHHQFNFAKVYLNDHHNPEVCNALS